MSFMLKKLKISLSKKEWIKGVMRRLWFHELFDAVLFLRLMSVGEIATWVFLDWKGRALSKRGVVYGTLVFRTESVDGKQRKGFYVVSYSDEPCLEMVIFLYIPSCNSVLVWKFFVMDGGRVRGERSEHVPRVVYETKVMKTVKQSSTNQNSCKCLREALTIWW